ncbi:hypothetical protein [Leptolinea tardivitalis]|uniref:hypothetical protein n=1 Tax=Leptolinea tardivitalis TaxID=229920 RepID=UPI0007837FA7|nr:hypothetical protein [Leptolinea tardivitalis]
MDNPISLEKNANTLYQGDRFLNELSGFYDINSSRIIKTSTHEISDKIDFDTYIFLTYKGYRGIAQFDDSGKIFTGEVERTNAIITFQGTTLNQIVLSFSSSIEMYIPTCEKDGVNHE